MRGHDHDSTLIRQHKRAGQLTVNVTTDVTMLGGSSWAVSELTNKTAVDGRGLSTISIRSGRYSRTSYGRVDSLAMRKLYFKAVQMRLIIKGLTIIEYHVWSYTCSLYKPAQFSGSSFFSLVAKLIALRYLWFILRLTPLMISSSLLSTVDSGFGPLQPPVTRTILGSTVSWNNSPTLSNLNPA